MKNAALTKFVMDSIHNLYYARYASLKKNGKLGEYVGAIVSEAEALGFKSEYLAKKHIKNALKVGRPSWHGKYSFFDSYARA